MHLPYVCPKSLTVVTFPDSFTALVASGTLRHEKRSDGAHRGIYMNDRPFKVLGIQQVAIGGLDKEKMKKLWIDSLGLTITGNFKSERENVDEDIAAIGSGPLKVEVDLMQPVDPEKKPAVQNTPLNHIGLWIDDLPAAVEWLTANGVRFAPGGIRKGAAGFDITFLHPKGNEEQPISGEGVLIELVQAPPEVIEAFAKLGA